MPGVCFQGILLPITSCIFPISENTSAENHNKKWLDLEDAEIFLVTFDFQEENYWTKSLSRRNWALPGSFIAPFLQLWEFFSLSLIANHYGPYNLWLTLIHVNDALSEGSDHYDFLPYFSSRALVLTAIQLGGQSSIHFPLYRNRHFAKTSEKETLFSNLSLSLLCVYIWLKGEFVI